MTFRELFQEFQLFERTDYEFENIGVWPRAVRLALALGLFALLVGLGYYLNVRDLNAEFDQAAAKEVQLKKMFEERAFEIANLEVYRLQMEQIEESFKGLLAQLPADTEVPGLLEDITEIGLGSSLQIGSITLQPEQAAEFYVELPIKIAASGGYHDFAAFISGIAGLPRIVTLHNYSIQSIGRNQLQLSIDAKTYRYMGDI
ncbi:MAG: type 4a pilus biogenesis protein PilO [Gammaproteobacteria bacterium]|nr:type 4a pilus biogenesis protein PilO [Gammaproteobacteria bacterium]MBK8132822.1 type 4a pilus biogenesis protein PilO [Gammaproteobacteria bacterium]MBK9428609.1 type 4a pilus biogenesis protein PilO [Gammaproteobacteria bacterium]